MPVSAASLLEDLLAAHMGASTVLRCTCSLTLRNSRTPSAMPGGATRTVRAPRALDAKLINVVGAAVGRRAARLRARLRPEGRRRSAPGSARRCRRRPARSPRTVRFASATERHLGVDNLVAHQGPSLPWDDDLAELEIAVAASARSTRRRWPGDPDGCCGSGATCRRAVTGGGGGGGTTVVVAPPTSPWVFRCQNCNSPTARCVWRRSRAPVCDPLELRDADRPEALPAAPDVQNRGGRR